MPAGSLRGAVGPVKCIVEGFERLRIGQAGLGGILFQRLGIQRCKIAANPVGVGVLTWVAAAVISSSKAIADGFGSRDARGRIGKEGWHAISSEYDKVSE